MSDFPPDPPAFKTLKCNHWWGRKPELRDYIVPVGPRTRIGYRVIGTDKMTSELLPHPDPDMEGCLLRCWKGEIDCVKVPLQQIPADAVRHGWEWTRDKKKKSPKRLSDLRA